MRWASGTGTFLLAATLLATFAASAPAAQLQFAPLDLPGPQLSHSRADLRASLTCTRNLHDAKRPPVLLLSGTTVDPEENFAWNWMPALTRAGYPWCASTAPDGDNMDDIQARGEYVTYAIRRMYRSSGRRIAIFGHSQGGMVGRWALRFWPGTRKMVADVVGAAPSNHGTESARVVCAISCPAGFWQQMSGSNFVDALNSRAETFRGISYTNVYTRLDAVVVPNADDSGSSSLHTGEGRIENVAVQEVCPGHLSDHLWIGTGDPVAWELFLDAVGHRGPGDPDRIDPAVCGEAAMPGIDPATFATDFAAAAASLATTSVTSFPGVAEEPPLRKYVFAR